MQNPTPTWCARVVLALVFSACAASAQAAAIYDFTFTDLDDPSQIVASGSFQTGDESLQDPGYDLLNSLTFDFITSRNGTVYQGPFVETAFNPGGAYNPTTNQFINHANGQTYHDLGGITPVKADGCYLIITFRDRLSNPDLFAPGGIPYDRNLRSGELSVTPADVTAVPEPASLVLVGTGLLGAAAAHRRKRRSQASQA